MHKFDLFIACPMSALPAGEYAAIRLLIVDLCDELRTSNLAPRIYFSGYDKTTLADFDHPYFGSQKDFAALAESDRFLLSQSLRQRLPGRGGLRHIAADSVGLFHPQRERSAVQSALGRY